MKKITIITIVLFALILSTIAQTNTRVRVNQESVGYWTITNDSMQIIESDNVYKGSVYVPSFSADSATVTGCTFTIDGHATNGIKIPPGEIAVNFGFDYAISDTVKIVTEGSAWVVLAIRRRQRR